MSKFFSDDKPIYVQIREKLEDQIISNVIKEGEQAPSTTQLVNFYKVNHVTVSKGVNQLVDDGILFKKRGIGMFVETGARQKLIERRRATFIDDYIVSLVKEADKLGITEQEIIQLIKKVKGSE